VVFWSLSEYLLHRFVFHYEPSSGWGQRLHFLIHGVHHDYPNDSKRLVMPPPLAVLLAIPFFVFFRVVLGSGGVFFGAMSGFFIGYLIYDMIHYAVHHAGFTHPLWIKLKQHHMLHHYQNPELGFGVSSLIWDVVFGTGFPQEKQRREVS
jgi:sterol desaturase/sphingolipid hydroxylase (fatty acid hydroxylase superfamily)